MPAEKTDVLGAVGGPAVRCGAALLFGVGPARARGDLDSPVGSDSSAQSRRAADEGTEGMASDGDARMEAVEERPLAMFLHARARDETERGERRGGAGKDRRGTKTRRATPDTHLPVTEE